MRRIILKRGKGFRPLPSTCECTLKQGRDFQGFGMHDLNYRKLPEKSG